MLSFQMFSKHSVRWSALALTGLLVVGCGGGGNESGPEDSLYLSPTSVEVAGAAGGCAEGIGPTVHVYGGLPPYKLANSVPLGMSLDKARLTHSGEGFTITFTNGVCMSDMPITVEDDMGRLAEVLVTNSAV